MSLGNTLMPIVLLAGIGLAAFYLLKDHPFFKSVGKGASDIGEAVGGTAHRASEFDKRSRAKEAEIGKGIMDLPGNIVEGYDRAVDEDVARRKADLIKDFTPLKDLIDGAFEWGGSVQRSVGILGPKEEEEDDFDAKKEISGAFAKGKRILNDSYSYQVPKDFLSGALARGKLILNDSYSDSYKVPEDFLSGALSTGKRILNPKPKPKTVNKKIVITDKYPSLTSLIDAAFQRGPSPFPTGNRYAPYPDA